MQLGKLVRMRPREDSMKTEARVMRVGKDTKDVNKKGNQDTDSLSVLLSLLLTFPAPVSQPKPALRALPAPCPRGQAQLHQVNKKEVCGFFFHFSLLTSSDCQNLSVPSAKM